MEPMVRSLAIEETTRVRAPRRLQRAKQPVQQGNSKPSRETTNGTGEEQKLQRPKMTLLTNNVQGSVDAISHFSARITSKLTQAKVKNGVEADQRS